MTSAPLRNISRLQPTSSFPSSKSAYPGHRRRGLRHHTCPSHEAYRTTEQYPDPNRKEPPLNTGDLPHKGSASAVHPRSVGSHTGIVTRNSRQIPSLRESQKRWPEQQLANGAQNVSFDLGRHQRRRRTRSKSQAQTWMSTTRVENHAPCTIAGQ